MQAFNQERPAATEKRKSMSQNCRRSRSLRTTKSKGLFCCALTVMLAAMATGITSCSGNENGRVQANGAEITVGVTKVTNKSLGRNITLSSELVPFQEIDVYAKESGYVKKLLVDYGSHVKAGQVMAVLEIPELEAQLQEDQAEIKNAT